MEVISRHICKNLFHTNCTSTSLVQGCAEADRQSPWTCTPCKTTSSSKDSTDNLILILNELKSIKSQQTKSDEVLVNISSSVSDLNSKVSQQIKQLSSLGLAINSLNKQLNVVTNDVKAHGKRFNNLETRITAAKKTLSETVTQSSSVNSPKMIACYTIIDPTYQYSISVLQ